MAKNSNTTLIGAVLISAVLISGSLVFLGFRMNNPDSVKTAVTEALTDFIVNGPAQDSDQPDVSGGGEPSAKVLDVDMIEVVEDDAVMGNQDAKVTIVEFSDYQCPYCRDFALETFPEIKANYIDTGLVKFVYRDFPISGHPRALPSAIAAECVREQTDDAGYFAMHDQLWEGGDLSDEGLIGYAESIVPDIEGFKTCLTTERYKNETAKDFSDGTAYGVSGTPSFIINGEVIVGALPYSNFADVIDSKLAE